VVDADGAIVFDLPLSLVLGKMPQKTFTFTSPEKTLLPLNLPENITVMEVLERVLRLVDVGSKRFLTNKVINTHENFARFLFLDISTYIALYFKILLMFFILFMYSRESWCITNLT
jgi:hypothetical protein